MADKISKDARSHIMSRIRSINTKPEIVVRKYLFSKGLRYRKNDSRYPGTPDIVLPRYHTVIFVHGCFWHKHEGCRYASLPESNQEFWKDKLEKNLLRDSKNKNKLEQMGWRVFIVWECELNKQKRESTLKDLYMKIIK